jgi:hypothetical protein
MDDKITIISSVFGNLPIVKECMDSWFPLPENWNLYVYDSKVSELDGTRDYLLTKKTQERFNLVEDGRVLTHTDAVKELLKHSTADWILHLDSDIQILDKNFYSWIQDKVNNTDKVLFGQIDYRHFNPCFNHYAKDGNYRFCLPRTASWILLFNRKFIDDNNLSFSNMDLRMNVGEKTFISNLSIKHKKDPETKQDILPTTLNVLADVSWQFFWEAYRRDLFEKIPDDIWNMCHHKHGASRTWHANNREVVNKFKSELAQKI